MASISSEAPTTEAGVGTAQEDIVEAASDDADATTTAVVTTNKEDAETSEDAATPTKEDELAPAPPDEETEDMDEAIPKVPLLESSIFAGEFLVYRPPGTDEDDVRPFDIVMLHGLNNGFGDTWGSTHLGSTLNEKYPKSRIVTCNYRSDDPRVSPFTMEGLRSDAMEVLNDLLDYLERNSMDDDGVRPIVFITHDIGGTIIKLALWIASLEYGKYRNILDSTRALIFFGCPHRGTALEIEDMVADLMFVTSKTAPVGASRKIQSLAKAIMDINGFFNITNLPSLLEIINVYSEDTDPSQRVFDMYNATFGVTFEERIGYSKSHKDLTKTADAEKFYPAIDRVLATYPAKHDDLSIESMRAFHNLASTGSLIHPLRNLGKRFQWVVEHESFESWLDSYGSDLLYVFGKERIPEASDHIIQSLDVLNAAKKSQDLLLTFKFERHNDQRNTVVTMLTTLLAQVFRHRQAMTDFLVFEQMQYFHSWTQTELLVLFKTVLGHNDHDGIIVVINGIDECSDTRNIFLEDLCRFITLIEHRVKILVTGVTDPVTKGILSEHSSLDLDQHQWTPKELKQYIAADVKEEIRQLIRHDPSFANFQVELRTYLKSFGQDTEWLRLMSRHLTYNLVLIQSQTSTSPPKSLEESISLILDSVPTSKQKWARKALLWILHAFRPLKTWELGTAIALEFDDPKTNEEAISDFGYPTIARELGGVFQGLFVINNHEIHLGHPAIRDFFLTKHTDAPWYDVEKTAHREIVEACCSYFTLSRVQTSISERYLHQPRASHNIVFPASFDESYFPGENTYHRYSFCSYAATYWPQHYKLIIAESTPSAILKPLLDNAKALRAWSEAFWWLSNCVSRGNQTSLSESLLPTFAGLGLTELLVLSDDVHVKDRALALAEAASHGHIDIVRTLLEYADYSEEVLVAVLGAGSSCENEELITELVVHAANSVAKAVAKEAEENVDSADAEDTKDTAETADSKEKKTETVETADAVNATDATDATDATEAVDATDAEDTTDATDAEDATDATDATDAADTSNATETADAIETVNETEAADATETANATGTTVTGDATDAANATGATDTANATKTAETADSKEEKKKVFPFPPAVLCRAVSFSMEDLAKKLLELGAPVQVETIQRMTPLDFSVRQRNPKILKLLIDNGAEIGLKQTLAYHPLHLAVIYGMPEMVQHLIDAGISLNLKNTSDSTATYLGCWHRHHKAVEPIIKAGADLNNDTKGQWTPLTACARRDTRKCAKILLENKANVEVIGFNEWTPLRSSTVQGYVEFSKLLLDHNADPNTTSGASGAPIICEVARQGNLELVKLLVERGATVTAADFNASTAVLNAGVCGKTEVVEYLFDHGANVLDEDITGFNTVALAAYSSFPKTVEMAAKKGVDIHNESKTKWTPIHYAYDDAETTRTLMDLGADPNRIAEYYTPLILAATFNKPETIKVLLEYHPKLEVTYDNPDLNPGLTALAIAVTNGYIEVAKQLLEAGSNVNHQSTNRSFPLEYPVRDNNLELLKLLLEYHPDPTIVDQQGNTALHCITDATSLDIARNLVNGGAPLHVMNKKNYTPLCEAISENNFAVTKYLIEKGSPLNTIGGEVGGPLHLASRNCAFEYITTLVEAKADLNSLDPCLGTPVQAACTRWAEADDTTESALRDKILRYFIEELGVDLHIEGGDYGCALNAICAFSTPEIIKLALDKDAKVNIVDRTGRAAIHFATSKGILNFLPIHGAGADLDARDTCGRSVLHWATIGGNTDVIDRVLSLSRGLLDERDHDGWTPLHWACRGVGSAMNRKTPGVQKAVIELLLKRGADPTLVATGGGGGREWSVLSIARYNGGEAAGLITWILGEIKKRADAKFDVNAPAHQSKVAAVHSPYCDSCLMTISGLRYRCKTCLNHDLCTKCFQSVKQIHFPEHQFNEEGPEFAPVDAKGKDGEDKDDSSSDDSDDDADGDGEQKKDDGAAEKKNGEAETETQVADGIEPEDDTDEDTDTEDDDSEA